MNEDKGITTFNVLDMLRLEVEQVVPWYLGRLAPGGRVPMTQRAQAEMI